MVVLSFACRSTFAPIMIGNLTRLGLPGNATLEHRMLAVDMASTLYWWDRRAASEQRVAANPMEVDGIAAAARQTGLVKIGGEKRDMGDSARLTVSMDDSIMNFLLRMAFVR